MDDARTAGLRGVGEGLQAVGRRRVGRARPEHDTALRRSAALYDVPASPLFSGFLWFRLAPETEPDSWLLRHAPRGAHCCYSATGGAPLRRPKQK